MTKKILIAIAVIIVAALIAVSVYFAFNDTTYSLTLSSMQWVKTASVMTCVKNLRKKQRSSCKGYLETISQKK